MNKYRNQVPLGEIKTIIRYLLNKFSIRSMVLAGGEPTLYKDFVPLMDYLGKEYIFKNKLRNFHLATNAIKCADEKFADYLFKFFIPNLDINSQLNISVTTLGDDKSILELKRRGILNLSARLANINNILVLTKENLPRIPKILKFLIDINQKYYRNSTSSFYVELRIPFLVRLLEDTYSSVPPSRHIKRYLTESVSLIANSGIPLKLRNIPLCYINNFIKIGVDCFIKKSKPSFRMVEFGPDSFLQPERIRPKKFLPEVVKIAKCKKCKFLHKCSGIDLTYLREFFYPPLKPF